MKKTLYILILVMFCFSSSAVAKESEANIKAKLDTLGTKLVQAAARNVMPKKEQKAVEHKGNKYIASYVEIDTNSLHTELHPSEKAGNYVGLIKYRENHYQCEAATKNEALNANCYRTRSRKLTEIISYDGKWRY